MVAPAIIGGLLELGGSLLGNKNQGDVSRYSAELDAQQKALDRAFNEKQLAIQEELKLKELAQTGQISEQEFKAKSAELAQRTAEANQNYEMSKATLEQRKAESEASTGLQGRALSETERINKARQDAYERSRGIGGDQAGAFGGEFMKASDTSNPYTADVEKDILSNQQENLRAGAGQMEAELAKQGVRGGQAVTQLRRGIGEMSNKALQDVNQMKYTDSAQREAEKRAYLAAMAQRGQAASLNAPSF